MMSSTESVCAGCGTPLPPPKAPGQPRKWCSERCRKRQYDRQCARCGARISGTDPGSSSGLCRSCVAKRSTQRRYGARRVMAEAMWADGYTWKQIQTLTGIKANAALYRYRGWDLPHRRSAEQVARIAAGWAAARGRKKARA
jgi:hypothetical protein